LSKSALRTEASRRCEDYRVATWRRPDSERQARLDEAIRHADSVTLHIINRASREQRAHLLQNLRDYIRDFTFLATGWSRGSASLKKPGERSGQAPGGRRSVGAKSSMPSRLGGGRA